MSPKVWDAEGQGRQTRGGLETVDCARRIGAICRALLAPGGPATIQSRRAVQRGEVTGTSDRDTSCLPQRPRWAWAKIVAITAQRKVDTHDLTGI